MVRTRGLSSSSDRIARLHGERSRAAGSRKREEHFLDVQLPQGSLFPWVVVKSPLING